MFLTVSQKTCILHMSWSACPASSFAQDKEPLKPSSWFVSKSSPAAAVKQYWYLGKGKYVSWWNSKKYYIIHHNFYFFFSPSEGYILHFPLGNISVDCVFSSYVLWSWLCKSDNFILVSLLLIFAGNYVSPNAIACDCKQDNVFPVPALNIVESSLLCVWFCF